MDATLEVRIDAEAKEAARQRAEAQGYSVSKAVRQLLALWVDGATDLAAIERARFGSLPKMEELRELAAYARFAGVDAMTTMGMGQVRHVALQGKR